MEKYKITIGKSHPTILARGRTLRRCIVALLDLVFLLPLVSHGDQYLRIMKQETGDPNFIL